MKFVSEHWIEVLLAVMIALSLLTHNKSLCISVCIVLALRLVHAGPVLQLLSDNGISWAVIILTVGFLAPVAMGKYSLQELRQVFTSPIGWVAIVMGVLVAVFGGKGVQVGQTDTVTTMGVIAGTFFGVAFFRGSPVGPLIGSGMSYFAIQLLRLFLPL